MKYLILLIVVLQISNVLTQSPPKLSNSFYALVNVTITDDKGEHHGNGQWGVNDAEGKGVEWYEFDHKEYTFGFIERYDLGKQYDISSDKKCTSFPVNGSIPLAWSWLALADFVATVGKGSEAVDIWEAKIGYATLRLGVKHDDPTTPVYLIRNSRDERKSSYYFATWNPTAPADSYFSIPRECPSSKSLDLGAAEACVARSTAISRAKVWVANKVPYNQGGDYEGYREDCSGYVSMCWESSKPGHTTSTMHEIAHPISKDDLQPGDCLLNAAEHVVLFGGWTNSAKTEYQAYEETRPGEGTVTRPTPYPYWYSQSSFKPYRYNDIC